MTTHLLAIGVNRSEIDRNIDPLKYAVDDARAMQAFFANELGCGDHAVLLDDEPTFADVRQRLDEIGRRVHAGDTFVLYFSGHGYLVQGEPYCLLSEAELAPLTSGRTDSNDLLSVSWLRQRVLNSWPKGVHMACIVDACRKEIHTGTRGTGGMAEYRQRLQGYVGRDPLAHLASPSAMDTGSADTGIGDIELYGCPDGEGSLEFDPIGRGMFTFALQSWLREGIERGEPRVLDEQLALVLQTGVDNLAREYRRESPGQRPQVKRNGAPVVLFNPMGTVRPLTQTQQDAVDRFQAQLAAGRLDEPYGDCARDTLTRLESLHLPAQQLKELIEQLQTARQRAREQADLTHDEDLMARAREMNTAAAWSQVAFMARLSANREQARQFAADLASPPPSPPPDPAEAAWNALGDNPDIKSLSMFMEGFEHSRFAERASAAQRALDDQAWDKANARGWAIDYEEYLKWPFGLSSGRHVQAARQAHAQALETDTKLDAQILAHAKALDSVAGWREAAKSARLPKTREEAEHQWRQIEGARRKALQRTVGMWGVAVVLMGLTAFWFAGNEPGPVPAPTAGAEKETGQQTKLPQATSQELRADYLHARQTLLLNPWWASSRMADGATVPPALVPVLKKAEAAAGANVPEALLDFGEAQVYGRGVPRNEATGGADLLRWMGQEVAGRDTAQEMRAIAALDHAISTAIRQGDPQGWGPAYSALTKVSGAAVPVDYWSGVMQRCLLRPAQTGEATKALQRATQTPAIVPNAEFYRLIAASHLRCQAKGMGCGAECKE